MLGWKCRPADLLGAILGSCPLSLVYVVVMPCSSTFAYPFIAHSCSTQKEVESELGHYLRLLLH